MLILADDELFEFCVSCGEFGGNMKVFVEFVLRLIFVDLKLSQNPYMPTTNQWFRMMVIKGDWTEILETEKSHYYSLYVMLFLQSLFRYRKRTNIWNENTHHTGTPCNFHPDYKPV